jgi:hypothetical protein
MYHALASVGAKTYRRQQAAGSSSSKGRQHLRWYNDTASMCSNGHSQLTA